MQHQVAAGIEDRNLQVGPSHAVGVVDIEDRRKRAAQIVDARNRLDALVVDHQLVPVDVSLIVQVSGHRDHVAVAGQQVADMQRTGEPFIAGIGPHFRGFTQQR